jgi:transposase-like protein
LERREWSRIIDAFLRDGTIRAVEQECGIEYRTAQKAVSAMRTAMANNVPESFSGICEADETYVGDAWKNKNIHIRRQGTKRGRGTSKQAVFGIIQRNPSRVRVWLVPNSKGRTTIPIIRSYVGRGSAIFTDGHKGYRRLPRYGYIHEWVDHEAGEYVRGEVHTQTIDGYWGLLKTHLDSIGGIRKERLPLFIGEHVWRYNFRHLTRKEQVKLIYLLLTKFGGRK